MSGGDELLPMGQKGNWKKFIETATSSVVSEQVATWAQDSTAGIGQVGGHTVRVSANLATTTSAAYAAGDLVGSTALTFSSVFRSTSLMTGVLQSLCLTDKTTQQAAFDFLILATATTGTTYTNDVAFALADGDLGKVIGTVSLYGSHYSAFSDNGVATVSNIGLPVAATTGTGLFMVAITRGTPTYVTTADLTLTAGFLVD